MRVDVDHSFPSMDANRAVVPAIRFEPPALHLAYALSGGVDSAVVSFQGVSAWGYGPPNDERLRDHPLWSFGLTAHRFHRLSLDDDCRWVATFPDGTFDVTATAVTVRAERIAHTPDAALEKILGPGRNQGLDEVVP